MTEDTTRRASTAHPLDPLSAHEFRRTRELLAREQGVGPGWRFASIELVEPEKAFVRAFRAGDPFDRDARAVVWDRSDDRAYVAVVSLTHEAVVSWTEISPEDGRPNATVDEWHDADEAMRSHPGVIAALAGRGITDMDLVLVDTWTYGAHLVPEQFQDRRVGWCDLWVRDEHDSNPYAHPVSGLKLVVDLNTMELLQIDDAGPVPGLPNGFAPVMGEYVGRHIPGFVQRSDSHPLLITQPQGTSVTLEGHELLWQKWRMRLGFNYREGLVLHRIGWEDGADAHGQPVVRSVADRMSFAEMVVPYRDPTPDHYRRTAYDIGEWGLGYMTTSLTLGCDCLGEIVYLDAVLPDSSGEPFTIKNAICIHEEDDAVLWKHVDSRAGAEVRRIRRLVISFHATVANYEYLVYWRFYEDGNIECEVRATGIMVTTPYAGATPPPYGPKVDQQTYAPIHQHFLTARLDLAVDTESDPAASGNTVVMSETEQLPIGPDNPHGLGLTVRNVPLLTEHDGKQDYDWGTQRAWKVTNPGRVNSLGTPVSYKLVPGAAIPTMLDQASPVFQRAQHLGHTLWVTPYSSDERWPAGEWVNQSNPGIRGLAEWTAANRSIDNTDVVLWYTFGIHHVPRPEEWPVMPVDVVSFWLKPAGFFDRNPSLDVAPSSASSCHPRADGEHCDHHAA